MKTKLFLLIMIAGVIFSACTKNKPADDYSQKKSEEITETKHNTQQNYSSTKWKEFASDALSYYDTISISAYYSHDLQMETLKGKVNRVDYEFYEDRDCCKEYRYEHPYSLVYDENGNLVSDSRYMYFDNVERDENGFFMHVSTGFVVSPEHHTEFDMVEIDYTYDDEGFMRTSSHCAYNCDGGTWYYKDSLPSCIKIGENGSDGIIEYEILETDYNRNWTLAKIHADYHYYSEEQDRYISYQENYYIQRIIMYS